MHAQDKQDIIAAASECRAARQRQGPDRQKGSAA